MALELFFRWGGSPDQRCRHGFSCVGSDPRPQNLPTPKILFLRSFRQLDVVNILTKQFFFGGGIFNKKKREISGGRPTRLQKARGTRPSEPRRRHPARDILCISFLVNSAVVPLINKAMWFNIGRKKQILAGSIIVMSN